MAAKEKDEILERQSQERMPVMPEVTVQERMAVMPEVKVQKAVAINGRTSSGIILTRRTGSAMTTPMTTPMTTTTSGVEDSTPVISTPEPAANNHQANEGKYCDFCSEYGHDTFDCASYKARRQVKIKMT
ncbi:hypothetical protein COOONC_15552 [Cooperia oncophora]